MTLYCDPALPDDHTLRLDLQRRGPMDTEAPVSVLHKAMARAHTRLQLKASMSQREFDIFDSFRERHSGRKASILKFAPKQAKPRVTYHPRRPEPPQVA